MLRSSPALLTLAFMASLVVPDTRAVAARDRTYAYDPANPGWAYCCDPDDEDNWVRLDGRAGGLWGPPADERARPVYVLAPEADGYAYTGSAQLESNWIRVVGWEGLLTTVRRSFSPVEATPVATQTLPPAPTPITTALPQPTGVVNVAPPVTQSPPPGTYELGPRDEVGIVAGCCQVLGIFLPLSFPEGWRGRTMQVTVENVQFQVRNMYAPLDPRVPPGEYRPATNTNRWEGAIYWAPVNVRAGDEYIGPGGTCGSGPRPSYVCYLSGWDPTTVGRWAVEPGRYFLFLRDHDTRYNERRILSFRFRLEFP